MLFQIGDKVLLDGKPATIRGYAATSDLGGEPLYVIFLDDGSGGGVERESQIVPDTTTPPSQN